MIYFIYYLLIALSFSLVTYVTFLMKIRKIMNRENDKILLKLTGFITWVVLVSLLFPVLVYPIIFEEEKSMLRAMDNY